jgi:hypothetical protein
MLQRASNCKQPMYVHIIQMQNGGIQLTDLITISGYCYRDMPVAGIYDAAALHLDLNMLESIGPRYLQVHKFDCFRAHKRRQCFC